VTIVAAYANREQLAIKIKSVYAPVPPKPVTPVSEGPRVAGPFTGDAPWALSALPECFEQESKTTGPRPYVLAHVPAGAKPVVAPATLSFGSCVLHVRDHAVFVDRDSDHMRIPPRATLYRLPGVGLALLRGADGAYELRTYRVTNIFPESNQ
jgi:hypothetical protein